MHGSQKTKKDATIEQKYESFWEFTSCPFYQQYSRSDFGLYRHDGL